MDRSDSVQSNNNDANQEVDYKIKSIIIGNSGVGKTCFLLRYFDDIFTTEFVSTVGIDFKVKVMSRDDKRINLQVWDTAGQERYRTITSAYYRGAQGFILMYDIADEQSFRAVQDWATQIETNGSKTSPVILVGNKCDLEEERQVTYDQGKKIADQLGFTFFETSAKANISIRETIEKLVDVIMRRMSGSVDEDDQDEKVTLQEKEKSGGCAC